VEGPEGWIISAGAERCHVEDVPAVSPELPAVKIIGRKADKGGDLLAAHLPELWQQSDERECQHRADSVEKGAACDAVR
jgi:hypothetical protein